MATKILIGAGTKGGVGRSTFLRILITWMQDAGVHPFLIDADDENPTMKRFFSAAHQIIPSRVKANDEIIGIAERDKHPIMAVDMKAGTGGMMDSWVANVPFEELETELGVTMLFIFVVTSSPDSVTSLLRWVNFLGGRVKYLIVKNLKDSDAADQKRPEDVLIPAWDATKQALEFRRLYSPAVIVMPALDPEYQSELERLNLTIRDVLAKHPNTPMSLSSLIVRQKLRNYQAFLYSQLEKHKELLLP
jgi:hypothetical protein